MNPRKNIDFNIKALLMLAIRLFFETLRVTLWIEQALGFIHLFKGVYEDAN